VRLLRILLAQRALRRAEKRALANRWDYAVNSIADFNRVSRARMRLSKAKYP
jgi:hypothetical protein